MKWKVKVVLVELSSMNFLLEVSKGSEREGESGVNRSIIDKLHSCDIKQDEMEAEDMVLLKVSLMNFILQISKEIK